MTKLNYQWRALLSGENRSDRLYILPHHRVAHFFAIRIPLLPIKDSFLNGADHKLPILTELISSPAIYHDVLFRERVTLRQRFSQPLLLDAIALASSSLRERLAIALASDGQVFDQDLEFALLRYLSRATSRSTPFGLFANTSLGRIGATTKLAHDPARLLEWHVRLDMGVLDQFVLRFQSESTASPRMRYVANNSIYQLGDSGRYVETLQTKGRRVYHLTAFERSPFISACLERAAQGATKLELVDRLCELDATLHPSEIADFVDELVKVQLLIPDIHPPITSPDALSELIDILQEYKVEESAALLDLATQVREQIMLANSQRSSGAFHGITERISQLLKSAHIPFRQNAVIQVDSFCKGSNFSITESSLEPLRKALPLFHAICASHGNGMLDAFKREFLKKFEGREVPLTEAIDEEAGIQIGQPASDVNELLGEISIGQPVATKRWANISVITSTLQALLEDAIRTGKDVIDISSGDAEAVLNQATEPMPPTFAAVVSLRQCSTSAHANIYLKSIHAPLGMQYFGRFCFGNAELHEQALDLVRYEQQTTPDVVFAEILHVPQGRVGNVICRPALRDYEIPFLAKSKLPMGRQIPISDLRVSVRNDRIVLRSEKLGKEVIPRLSAAHNFGGSNLGMYQFLCSLQVQGNKSSSFHWGPVFDGFSFLPQLRYAGVVISLAKWKLHESEIRALKQAQRRDPESAFANIQELRAKRSLPATICVDEGDNFIQVSLNSPIQVKQLVDMLDERQGVWIREAFQTVDQAMVTGPSGEFANEIVVPFLVENGTSAKQIAPVQSKTLLDLYDEGSSSEPMHDLPRRLFPGSEWAYIKIYGSAKALDIFVAEDLERSIESAIPRDQADWFFLRYADPDTHLRLRIRADPTTLWSTHVPRLLSEIESCVATRNLGTVQIDTYVREIERYGGPGAIELCESYFCADSRCVARSLQWFRRESRPLPRWQFAILSGLFIAQDFFEDTVDQRNLFDRLFATYAADYRKSAALKDQLANLFRRHRSSIDSLVEAALDDKEAPGLPLSGLLQARRRDTTRVRDKIKQTVGGNRVRIVSSLMHMNQNRIFLSEARKQELVVYYLLVRYLESKLAQSLARRA